MKEPDPPEAFDQMILESFNELHAEAQIMPTRLGAGLESGIMKPAQTARAE